MATLIGQSCSALAAQSLLVDFNCEQTCLNIVTAMAIGCGPMASPMTGRRLGSPPHEQQRRTSHHRVNVGPCIIE
jgi:hypothetical protein